MNATEARVKAEFKKSAKDLQTEAEIRTQIQLAANNGNFQIETGKLSKEVMDNLKKDGFQIIETIRNITYIKW